MHAQTYEGGLGGEPGNEAHGGYTFCGLAALMLVDQAHQLDLPRLVHWAVHMQVSRQSTWPICGKCMTCLALCTGLFICRLACKAHGPFVANLCNVHHNTIVLKLQMSFANKLRMSAMVCYGLPWSASDGFTYFAHAWMV